MAPFLPHIATRGSVPAGQEVKFNILCRAKKMPTGQEVIFCKPTAQENTFVLNPEPTTASITTLPGDRASNGSLIRVITFGRLALENSPESCW